MHVFTDGTGRTWEIALTIAAAKRVRDLVDVNLLELDRGKPPLLTRLGLDVILLCDVIFALIKPQADPLGVSDSDFAGALGGDVILAAQNAFREELVDFFRKLSRIDLAKAIEAQRQMINLAVQENEHRVDELDLEAEMEAALGSSSTDSPPSPE